MADYNHKLAQLDNIVEQAAQETLQAKVFPAAAVADNQSFMKVQDMSSFVEAGKLLDDPIELVENIVVEHETTVLFADTGVGKTTLALQMAIGMAAEGRRTMYVNFELSPLQIAKKFTDKVIPPELFIANIDYSLMNDVTDQSLILGEIENQALKHGTSVIIIDNLTNLCINSKEGSEAGTIMLKLLSLRMMHDWTMLILAHVPKRKPTDPITINDLAGSKIISNIADNVVAMNKSKLGADKRYLIQLKYRSLPIKLDYRNVQELTLTTTDGYLHFELGGFCEERLHLPRSRDEKEELEKEIAEELMKPQRESYREIAQKLGTSASKVSRVAKELQLDNRPNSSKK